MGIQLKNEDNRKRNYNFGNMGGHQRDDNNQQNEQSVIMEEKKKRMEEAAAEEKRMQLLKAAEEEKQMKMRQAEEERKMKLRQEEEQRKEQLRKEEEEKARAEKRVREKKMDQTEALIAAIRAQVEKEKAAKEAANKKENEKNALNNSTASDTNSKPHFRTISKEEMEKLEERKRRKAAGLSYEEPAKDALKNPADKPQNPTNVMGGVTGSVSNNSKKEPTLTNPTAGQETLLNSGMKKNGLGIQIVDTDTKNPTNKADESTIALNVEEINQAANKKEKDLSSMTSGTIVLDDDFSWDKKEDNVIKNDETEWVDSGIAPNRVNSNLGSDVLEDENGELLSVIPVRQKPVDENDVQSAYNIDFDDDDDDDIPLETIKTLDEIKAEEAKRKAEQETRHRMEEDAKRQAEEMKRKEAEEASRKAEEETRRKVEEEARRKVEEARRQEEAKRQAEEETRRKEEEETRRRAEEEARRKVEEARRQEEVKRQAEEEARRKAEEMKRQAEEEERRKAEEMKRQAEEEARRKAEEMKRQAEEEARRKAEEMKRQAEEEERRKAEEMKRQAEEEARRKAEEMKRQAEDEERRKEELIRQAEEEVRRQEEEDRRQAAEVERQKALELKRKEEDIAFRKRLAEEAKRQAEEEEKRAIEKAEARRKFEEEANRREEEERRRLEEARRREQEEIRRRIEEETRRRIEEETKRRAEEMKRKAEEEAKRREKEESKRLVKEAFENAKIKKTEDRLPIGVEQYLGKYLSVNAISDQILSTIREISENPKDSKNVVILGQYGFGTTAIAEDFARSFYAMGICKNKVIAKIKAGALNRADINIAIRKLQGGCLIIENAGVISNDKLDELYQMLNNPSNDVIVIMAGQIDMLSKIFKDNVLITSQFKHLVQVHRITDMDVFSIAKNHATALKYPCEKDGERQLQRRMQSVESGNLDRVLKIVDSAVSKAKSRELMTLEEVHHLVASDFEY